MITTQKIYAMLGNESLWEIALRCHQILEQSAIPHSVCEGVAVCLYGYQRNTTDVDMIINARDSAMVKDLLLAASSKGRRLEHSANSAVAQSEPTS